MGIGDGHSGAIGCALSALAMVFSDDAAVEQVLAAETPEAVLALLGDVNDAVDE